MSKALVLSYWNVNQPATGGLRRIHALLGAIGPKQVILCQPSPAHPACETVPLAADFGRRKRGINWGLFNFFWPSNALLVRRTVRERKPALVVLTSIWAYFPIRDLRGVPVVLDAHDVLASAIAGRFGPRHPFTRIVAAWESRVARSVDHLFVCSGKDRERFLSRYGLAPERVTTVPNGVEISRYDAPAADVSAEVRRHLGDSTALFFMGKLTYEPNARALAFLNHALLPELERRAPGRFRLVVTGGSVPARRMHPCALLAGTVSDAELAALIRRADICLSPVFSGGGTRLKILEYMAAGRPVVSTAKGAEGIEAVPGKHLVLAEAEGFADAVVRLAGAPSEAQAIGEAGRRLVAERYDWSAIRKGWQDVLGRWLERPAT